jgi:hypothetical protein
MPSFAAFLVDRHAPYKEHRPRGDIGCGIPGFGNVGIATARLMRAFGMKIQAIRLFIGAIHLRIARLSRRRIPCCCGCASRWRDSARAAAAAGLLREQNQPIAPYPRG